MCWRQKRLVVPLAALVLLVCLGANKAAEDGLPSTILLAPTLRETQEAIARLERLVAEADATALALFRVHNGFGEERRRAAGLPNCESRWMVDLASRARLLGADLRDRVQSARAGNVRVERMLVARTVEPLVDAATRFRARNVSEHVALLERRYLESAAWHSAYVERVAKSCPTMLQPAPGFGGPGLPLAAGEGFLATLSPGASKEPRPQLTAVIAEGGGFICPGAIAAKGVVILDSPRACWAPLRCDCRTAEILPAAVVGRGVRDAPDSTQAEQQPVQESGKR